MAWDLLLWLVAVVIQGTLLGIIVYQFINLTDLRADYINPHDCCERWNKVANVEVGAQILLTALLLLTGKWFLGLCHVCLSAYMIGKVYRKEHILLVTDVFNRLKKEMREDQTKLGIHVVLFVAVMYRLVQVLAYISQTPHGRRAMQTVFKQAAAAHFGGGFAESVQNV